eukprot:TRINITY_DN26373_c0_g1_i1.p2 TRINITY_DN26373_c0_g1~~TRINITY_DN26373_c0_g1_i1.p2  ORF type:complete len:141 (+),score=2.20 TRINITY_DN26373_c0_g1_i1:663-1085(+)
MSPDEIGEVYRIDVGVEEGENERFCIAVQKKLRDSQWQGKDNLECQGTRESRKRNASLLGFHVFTSTKEKWTKARSHGSLKGLKKGFWSLKRICVIKGHLCPAGLKLLGTANGRRRVLGNRGKKFVMRRRNASLYQMCNM